jgi:tetratricopeptide (TPR) repeat protein
VTRIIQRKRLRQAIALKNQGRLEEAERVLAALVETNPELGGAWLELGNVRLGRSEARLAFEAFNRAAGFIDSAAEAHTALGRLATPGAGDHIRCRNFCQAVVLNPTCLPALTDLTELRGGATLNWFVIATVSNVEAKGPFQELIKRGKIEPSIQLARMAAVVRPDLTSTTLDLAALVFRLEDLEGKAKYLKRATVLRFAGLGTYIETVDALFQAEEFESARKYAQRALKIDPDNAQTLFWLGRTQRRLDRFDESRATFAETLRQDESFAQRIQVIEQGVNPADFQD